MILFPYASVETGAYRQTGPIFVHARECERYAKTGEYPQQFAAGRTVRAYDQRDFMIDARVVNGEPMDVVIEELLSNPAAEFLHVHSVTRGCYTFGVERI
jgi:predicted DNA binding protein